jgi:small subunit ribosomal protein S9
MVEKKKTIKIKKDATKLKATKVVKEPKKRVIVKKLEPEEVKEETIVAESPEIITVATGEEEKSGRKTYLYAAGRRKEAVAQVRLIKNGSGKVTINGRELENYFGSPVMREIVTAAIVAVGQDNKLDISAKVSGGGLRGQAEAIRLGVSRALLDLNPVFRKSLRRHGFLTRDSRMKERKKPGLKRARRAPQWQKR